MSPSVETANVGKAVAARVGTNIREVRTKLGLTQAQLAAPEFSISYISAIERGKIRPSLKALSILAKRLDVPLTFLLEGSPSGAAEARAVGYSPTSIGSAQDIHIDVDLSQAKELVQHHDYQQASELLAPIQLERITTEQAYRLHLLRGQIHLGLSEYSKAVAALRMAVTQGEALDKLDYIEKARILLWKACCLIPPNFRPTSESFRRGNLEDVDDFWDYNVEHLGIVEWWHRLEISEKVKTRPYITIPVMILWMMGTIIGFIRLATVGDMSILIYSPAVLMAPLLIILYHYFGGKKGR